MAEQAYHCPKCGGTMTKGFLAERGESATRFIAQWTEGDPQPVQFLGLTGENVNTAGRRQFPVRSLRCGRCGFLELYAV